MNKLIHGPNIAGQSLADRVTAARHSIAGQGLAKSVCKATTEEIMGPKKKHLDYLIHCTNEPNVSIPQLANLLIERTQNHNWVVVFKGLVSIHNLMNYGNERFTQYLASNNCTFNLSSFLDKAGVQGYDMSTFIRRYAKYLNEKSMSYRCMAFDFCKVKRGKEDGLLRTMNAEKLLKTLPVLQRQVDALLEFDVSPNELSNGVINACFMLQFKDLIRLFACYNDGIINLLEKFFEMNKKQGKEALDIYKRFLVRMDRTSEFLKVCESVGIDKGDIPDLAKAPSSLLEALEEHLKSLESSKKTGAPAPKPAAKITSEISTFAAAATSGVNAAVISDEEKQRILDEESRELELYKKAQEMTSQGSPTSGASPAANPFNPGQPPRQQSLDLFSAGAPTSARPEPGGASLLSDDLFGLDPGSGGGAQASAAPNPFAASASANNPFAPAAPAAGSVGDAAWGSPSMPVHSQTHSAIHNGNTNFTSDAQFDAAFGYRQPQQSPAGVYGNSGGQGYPGMPVTQPGMRLPPPLQPAFEGFGEILRPRATTGQAVTPKSESAFVHGDLDSSLASLAGNLSINPQHQIKKSEHSWSQANAVGDKKMTGGGSWGSPAMGAGGAAKQPMGAMSGGGMVMGAQPGFQQPPPAMVGAFPQQQQPMVRPVYFPVAVHGMGGQRPAMAGMGQPQQQGVMWGAQGSQGFGQTAGGQPTNDPFGAL